MKNIFLILTLILALSFSNVTFASTSSRVLNNYTNTEVSNPKTTSFFALPFCYYHTTTTLTLSPDGTITQTSETTLICTIIIL